MRQRISLKDHWRFCKAAGLSDLPSSGTWEQVRLPHTWNATDGQDGGNDYFRGTCCYVRKISRAQLPQDDQYYLEFHGANASASVYLNGFCLAQHDGGYSTWRVNITSALMEENELVVLVDNGVNDRVYPQNADSTFYGGLYRDVDLITVPQSHFDLDHNGSPGLKVTATPVDADAAVEIETWLTDMKSTQKLTYTLCDAEGHTVAQTTVPAAKTKVMMTIPHVHRWHGRTDPYLYQATILLTEGDQVLDQVHTCFGCRTFRIDPEKGFYLNDEPYPLHGVSRHQDWEGIGNVLLPEHHDRDMELICEMGANTIRLAHYQHDSYFYDLCDRHGMIVWAEIPYISTHMENGFENTLSQMKELIIQNYNHPSIVVWGLSNEITIGGDSLPGLMENHLALNELAHSLDPTRKTVLAAVSMCDIHHPLIHLTDAVSYNHYFGWYGGDTAMNGQWLDQFHKTYPNRPIGLSEYGCEALNWHTSHPQQGDYTEEYQAYYHQELIKQLFSRPYLWATHVWNMFDFGADARAEGGKNGRNHKGLVTFDRKYKKDAFYAYKAWLSDEPFVHICGKRYVDRVESLTKVTVYSNLPQVELFANGQSLGKQICPQHFFSFEVPNAGETTLVAVAGHCRDESRIRKVDTFCEAYRLKEQGAVLNWFDITAPQGCYSLNDKLGDIQKSDEAKAVLASFIKPLTQSQNGVAVNAQMLEMLNGYTVVRLINMMGAALPSMPAKQQLLDINKQLNQIPKNG